MATFDIINLYCNINDELKKQVIEFWRKNSQKHYTQDRAKFLTYGREQILNNNSNQMVWFVLWYANHCRLSNAKSGLYKYLG